MNNKILPYLVLCILPVIVLFEPLFLDASLMSLDNRLVPPFCYHLTDEHLPKVMNIASCDINIWLMPETLLQLERIREGEFPLWNECEHLGQPLMAMLGFSAFYPSTLLYLVFGPYRGYAVSMALHLLLIGLGMWCFLLSRKLKRSAALVGAVSLSLCAFITVHIHIPQFVQVATWFPWMMLASDRLIERPGFRRAVVFGIAIGLCFLGGFPQISMLSLFAIAAWFLAGLIKHAEGKRRRVTIFAATAVLLGALLSSIQLLPSSELLSESIRKEGWSAEVLRQKRFAPQSLVGLVMPRFFGPAQQEFFREDLTIKLVWDFPSVSAWQETESQNGFEENAVFLGLIPFFLAMTSFFRKWRRRELFPRILLIVTLMFCMGLFFFSGWCEKIPGISTGSPKRALFIFTFALAWLAALEFDRFREDGSSVWLLPGGISLMILGAMAITPYERWLFPDASQEEHTWFRETLTPDLIRAVVIGAILVLAALAVRLKRAGFAIVLLIAGTAGELVLFSRYLNPPQQLGAQYQTTPVIDWLAERGVAKDKRVVPFNSPEVLPPSMIQVFGLRSCCGFVSMVDKETGELLRALEPGILNLQAPGLTDALKEIESLQSPVLDMIGAHYVSAGSLGYRQLMAVVDELPEIEFAYGDQKECLAVFERKNAMPPAYLVRELRVIPDSDERLAYLVSADFDPTREAVVEKELEDFPLSIPEGSATPRSHVHYERPSPERIEIEVDCEAPAFLVVSESHYPGWCVEVDGNPAPLHRANHALMGVSIPRGAKSVVLSYEPHTFYAGFGLSLLGMMLCVAFLLKR
ncbi:MAG: YfhO family protein [Planctomycetota bacterium]|jgi:hypothetical protein